MLFLALFVLNKRESILGMKTQLCTQAHNGCMLNSHHINFVLDQRSEKGRKCAITKTFLFFEFSLFCKICHIHVV